MRAAPAVSKQTTGSIPIAASRSVHWRSAAGCDHARFTSPSGVPCLAASASRTGTLVSPTATRSRPRVTAAASGSRASVMAPTTAFSSGITASSIAPVPSPSSSFSKLA